MLRADVPGIDSRLLEQRVRQELAAHPNDPAPPPDDDRPAGVSPTDSASIPPGGSSPAIPPETPAAPPPDDALARDDALGARHSDGALLVDDESHERHAGGGYSASSGALPAEPTPDEATPNGASGLIGRTMARLGALYRQHSRHHQLQRRFAEVWGWAGETADKVHALSRQIDALRLQLSALGDQHRELATLHQTLHRALVEKQREQHDAHERRLARLDHTAVRLEGDLRFEHRRVARLVDAAGDAAGGGRPKDAAPGDPVAAGDPHAEAARPASLSAASELSGRFAQGFEERFRGSREDIKGRLKVHLDRVRGQPVVSHRQPLLDVGCGRGEWLELLAEAAVPAYGVDANPLIVDACQRRGLTVIRADAIEHLARLPERALGAITAFHVIEHLVLEDLLRLIDEARRTLVPNGILILETPNPENLKVGALTFHQDPTHLRPLPPVLVEYLVASRGFHEVELMRLHPYPAASLVNEDSEAARRLNELLYGPQDIAVLARRA